MIKAISGGRAYSFVCAVVFFTLAATSAAEEAPPRDWLLDHEKIVEKVDGIERIVLINHHGNVRLQKGAQHLEGQTLAQHARDDPFRAHALVTRDNGTLRLELTWRAAETAPATTARNGTADEPNELWAKRRIDVGFNLPADIAVEVQTAGGEIKSQGLTGPLVARSGGGDVLIRGSHAVTADTGSGELRMVVRDPGRGGPIQATSTTGNLRIDLAETSGGTIELSTRGPITTDFSLTIQSEKGSTLKQGRIELSGPGPSIRLKSGKGAVRIGRLIVE